MVEGKWITEKTIKREELDQSEKPETKTEAVKEQVEKDQSEKPEKETEDKKNINNQGE